MAAQSLRLPPSNLGKKEHWDRVYKTELSNFEENGDEGEVWFGEESLEKMVAWVSENISPSTNPFALEIGSGNGTLLIALAEEAGYSPTHLLGIDYSHGAVDLAKSVAAAHAVPEITFAACNFLTDHPPRLAAIQCDEPKAGCWDILLDKGTFDAIALAEVKPDDVLPITRYREQVYRLLKPGGYFLITSCNFTEEELQSHFESAVTGLVYHSRIEYPKYTFGGRSGSVCSGVAFQKAPQL